MIGRGYVKQPEGSTNDDTHPMAAWIFNGLDPKMILVHGWPKNSRQIPMFTRLVDFVLRGRESKQPLLVQVGSSWLSVYHLIPLLHSPSL